MWSLGEGEGGDWAGKEASVPQRAVLGTQGLWVGKEPWHHLEPGPYFLLSSLARQVAASTALMVAARSPPCSKAWSP